MNDWYILKPIDNTTLDNLIHTTYEKGYSEYNRLYIPNEGINDNGDTVHYLPYGSIAINPGLVAVHKNNVFLKNGYLEKPGIIVEKYYISKGMDGILLGDEKYFRVVDSNIDSIFKNNLVIVMAGQANRFNYNKKEFFFVKPSKILIVLSNKGIDAGPDNIMLESMDTDILGIADNSNKGTYNNETYYFAEALYDFVIANTKYMIVNKKDIKLTKPTVS